MATATRPRKSPRMGGVRYCFFRAGMRAYQPESREENPKNHPQIVVKRLIDYIFAPWGGRAETSGGARHGRNSSERERAGLECGRESQSRRLDPGEVSYHPAHWAGRYGFRLRG